MVDPTDLLRELMRLSDAAAREGKSLHQYYVDKSIEMSRAINATLPDGLRKSQAQMDHVFNCPLGQGVGNLHICTKGCGYPDA